VPASSGGQAVAQAPSQFDFEGFAVSRSYTYSVRPEPSTTTVPKFPTEAVDSFAVPVAAGADELGALDGALVEALELPPQAVRVDSPRTAVPTTKAMRFISSFSLIF
jgi:hypothetical protein